MLYHWFCVLCALAAGPLTSRAPPVASRWGDIHLKHAWDAVPENWEILGPPPPGTLMDLRIALKPHRENALVDTLYEVSSPDHPRYGMHLSWEQVAKLVAPHPKTLGLVTSWLNHYGVPSSSISTTHSGEWLKVTSMPVSQANSLLGASYQLYRHTETNDTIIRTIGYALPTVLHAHVKTVAPTTYFGSPPALSKQPGMGPGVTAAGPAGEPANMLWSRDNYVTPSHLRWLYRSETYVTKAKDRNKLGVAGYLEQYPNPIDLWVFMKGFLGVTDANYDVETTNGGVYLPNNPGTEANLNMQWTQGMAYPTPHIFYSTGGKPPFVPDSANPINVNEPFLEWLEYLLGEPTRAIPPTITSSYSESEQTVPPDYAASVCDLFAVLGSRGVSFLTTSGNFGVGQGDCKANDGSGKVQFLPRFPASCPWVTTVGGTQAYPEVAASFSGGGFSNYFEVPDYQRTAVSTYIRNLDGLHDGLFNASSRGYPDISAQAVAFPIVVKEKGMFVEGTSCAAPVTAGIISLINDFRLFQNMPKLGFLNNLLYGIGQSGLNDITSGSNRGCGTGGFPAVVGWDPITGLGTPDFLNLQEAAQEALRRASATSSIPV